MIMEELGDVDKAIEFAKEQDDAELWEDLISYSIDKPRMAKPPTILLFNISIIFFVIDMTCFNLIFLSFFQLLLPAS